MDNKEKNPFSADLLYQFELFVEFISAPRLNKTIRKLVLEYFIAELESGIDISFIECLQDIKYLFYLLNSIEEEHNESA